MVIGFVAVDLAGPAPPAAGGHPHRWGCRPTRPRTWSSRWRRPHSGPLTAAARRARRPGAACTLACRDRPGLRRSDPPLTARRLKESTLTRSRSIRPAAPSSSNRTAWSGSNTPARVHWSSRRQQMVALPQPSSLAGSRLQGVEVRAMKMTAPTQLRSGTRRGTPPHGPGGGAGSSGWMRCHSASGSSRSTRLVMAGASQHQPESLKPPYRPFRNVHLSSTPKRTPSVKKLSALRRWTLHTHRISPTS
jgi:hypothetical protein